MVAETARPDPTPRARAQAGNARESIGQWWKSTAFGHRRSCSGKLARTIDHRVRALDLQVRSFALQP
jgi:hypothetical protein